MKCSIMSLLMVLAMLFASHTAYAHTVNYDVQQKSVAVIKVFYTANDPASYSQFEVYAPDNRELPYQTGRTDRNGFVAFVPDRQGTWTIKVLGESSHGYHGVTVDVKVDNDLNLESFKKPLAAQYSKIVIGVSLIIGLFGIYAMVTSRRQKKEQNT